MSNKKTYISQRFTHSVELPKGMWQEVKNKIQKEVNFKPTATQTFLYVFLNFLQKTIDDYDKEKQNDR